MWMKRMGFGALLVTVFLAAPGCKRSSSEATGGKTKSAGPPALARVRWFGKKQALTDTNLSQVATIWNTPESRELETNTLDRLALAPVLWLQAPNIPLQGTTNEAGILTNSVTALLRPLAEDMLLEETYLEIRQAGATREAVLAVHAGEARQGVWRTNLAAALEYLTSVKTSPGANGKGWTLKPGRRAEQITLAQLKGWTLVGLGPEKNTTLTDLEERVSSAGSPAPPASSKPHTILALDLDLAGLSELVPSGWFGTNGLPQVEIRFVGDGDSVRTRAELYFPTPLARDLPDWDLPTAMIHDPLSSFTAMRGTAQWLGASPFWKRWLGGEGPERLFIWAQGKLPLQTYLAVPVTGADARVKDLLGRLTRDANPWLATNSFGQFERTTNNEDILWMGVPFADPSLWSEKIGRQEFLVAGMGANQFTNRAMPDALKQQILSNPNLVVYDWELTGQRVEAWIYASQLFRLLSRLPQVPPNSASIAWLKSLSLSLGNCGTTIVRSEPSQLSVTRRSTIGLTAFELNLLADWLESPTFPAGLHSTVAPQPPPPKRGKPTFSNP